MCSMRGEVMADAAECDQVVYECLDCHQFFWTWAEFEEHKCGYESEDE